MKHLTIPIIILFLFGCTLTSQQEESFAQNVSDSSINSSRAIKGTEAVVHIVFFNLKEDANIDEVTKLLYTLEEIEEVDFIEVGAFADLGDSRAMSEYELMMEMDIDDVEAYKRYQVHPIHLEVKKKLKPLLEAAPASYDYLAPTD